jgi:hypothetical protein
MWERRVRKEENDMNMTGRSHVSDKSRGFKIGAVARVGDKSIEPQRVGGSPYFIKRGLNKGHCLSCSNAPAFTTSL